MFLNYNKLGKKTLMEPEFKTDARRRLLRCARFDGEKDQQQNMWINKAVRQGMRHLSVQGQDLARRFSALLSTSLIHSIRDHDPNYSENKRVV